MRLTISGRSVLDATVRALRAVPSIGLIVLALDGIDAGVCLSAIERPAELRVAVTATRANRWQAIEEALDTEPSLTTVLLHAPERPLLAPASLMALLAAPRGDGAVLGVAVHETVKRVAGGIVVATIPRETLHAVQAPFVFRREPFAAAVRRAVEEGWTCRDELQLARRAGLRLRLVDGPRSNVPIQSALDARYAELRSMAGGLGLDAAAAG
jgi:2-C-methyl-D-erythritol 4-phosphate cytidylyltransferase